MKLKLSRPKMAADFRRDDDNTNRCHPERGYLCPQHAALAKWKADNVRLGIPDRNAWYDRGGTIPCGPMIRV